MAHDVFISYAKEDKPVADAVVAKLESNTIRCWIAPRDIWPGSEWGEAIMSAIAASRAVVLVFTAHANVSPQVRREVQTAFEQGLPVVPLRVEDVRPAKGLAYYLGPVHWLDAMTPPLESHLIDLVHTVQRILGAVSSTEPLDSSGKLSSTRDPHGWSREEAGSRAEGVSAIRRWIMREERIRQAGWMGVGMSVVVALFHLGYFMVGLFAAIGIGSYPQIFANHPVESTVHMGLWTAVFVVTGWLSWRTFQGGVVSAWILTAASLGVVIFTLLVLFEVLDYDLVADRSFRQPLYVLWSVLAGAAFVLNCLALASVYSRRYGMVRLPSTE